MNCERVRKQENVEKISKVKDCIAKECKDSTKVAIGGDMNGHIWELDKCENANGKLIKELSYEAGLTIVNCEWEGMNEPTWFMNDKEYTLDYILVNEKGYGCIREAGVMDTNEVVESDHAAVWMKVGGTTRNESRHHSQKKSIRKKKKKLRKSQMEEYGIRVDERGIEDYQDMIKILTEVGEDMNDDKRTWKEDRSGWFNAEVKRSIQERKKANREYRLMRKVCGTGDARILKAKRDYESKKYEARTMIERTLNTHNEKLMSEIGKNGDSKALYSHIGRLMKKGKSKSVAGVSVRDEAGALVDDSVQVKREIGLYWSKLFNMDGNAKLGIEKGKIGAGMFEVENVEISVKELKDALKCMKSEKAEDETGVIAEYLKALNERGCEKLREVLNVIMNGGEIPKEWKESRVTLIHKGGSAHELKNYRPIAIVNIVCKLCMIIIRNRMNEWVESSRLLGDVQGGFRRGRRTEDNLFMLERMMEMNKVRGEQFFIAFVDMEKAYDRVNRKKLFEVMRGYGISEYLVRIIERVYEENRVKFVLEDVETDWCTSNSGVRQGCPLSPLLFNIYFREIAQVIEQSEHGFRYSVVKEDGSVVDRVRSGFMYADDICLVASSEEKLQSIMNELNGSVEEYGMKVSEAKSKVVCINGNMGERQWMLGRCKISEVRKYTYLGVTVEGGLDGGFKSMGDRMKDANRVIGMVKYAAKRSGSRFVIGREGWKSMVVSKLMYGAGALAWYQAECDDLEVLQNEMGRWIWGVRTNVRNELVRGETGFSTFQEREAKAMSGQLMRIVFDNSVISEIGRACLIEIGGRSRWWARMRHICTREKLSDLVNLICLGDVSAIGMNNLSLEGSKKVWQKYVTNKIMKNGCEKWKNCLKKEAERQYLEYKRQPAVEEYARYGTGGKMRLWIRGECMPVRSNEKLEWKYDCKRVCGEIETERHVLQDCKNYEEERKVWQEKWVLRMGNADQMSGLKGYLKCGKELDTCSLVYMGRIWCIREKNEAERMANV